MSSRLQRLARRILGGAALLAPFAGPVHSGEDPAAIFARHGITGAFVLFDARSGAEKVVNPSFAAARRIPASTFKIANSLIALETGAVRDTDEIIPYGGQTRVAAWAKDMSMRDAIVVSNVPVYQELARRVGLDSYRDWLHKFSYGNADPGTDPQANLDNFWLNGPLQISPSEQTRFLARLAQGHLPLSARSQTLVREILEVDQSGAQQLFAKSGWTVAPDPDIGWYVGWVQSEDQLHSFALVIEMRSSEEAALRKTLSVEILRALGVY